MILRKCPKCKKYTLQEVCSDCKINTHDAHYKFRERFVKNN